MIKTLLSGIAIGIVNIIPGVSGGTIMVMLGILDKTTDAISHIFKKDNLKYVALLFLGVAIGIIGFANIMESLIDHYPHQTMFWFIGLITVSIPFLKKHKLPKTKISILPFIIGVIVILTIGILNEQVALSTIDTLPILTIVFLLEMLLLGFVSGAATIFPGISGSMLLLVLGYYGIYNNYAANILSAIKSFDLNILIPVGFIGVGILLGVFLSSKLTSYLIKNYKTKTMSLIIGLVVGSIFILIPTTANYNLIPSLTYIGSFIFGGGIVYILEKVAKY